jgi:hypothetical protein
MPFKKGESGNPAGRKASTPNKVAHDIKVICQKMGPQLIEGLREMAFNGKTEAIRLAATEQLLSRGYGKPPQAIVGESDQPIAVRHIISWIGEKESKVALPAPDPPSNATDVCPFVPEEPLPWQH